MRKIKKSLSLLTIFFLLLSFYSCNKELTREKAKELIKRDIPFPIQQEREIKKKYENNIKYEWETFKWGSLISELDKWEAENLKREGYINFDVKINIKEKYQEKTAGMGKVYMGTFIRNKDIVTFTITNKGKPYLVKEGTDKYILKVCDIEMGEITGIKMEGESKATVYFTIKPINITPFGSVKTYKEKPYTDKYITNHAAVFELYDDGWRIKENSIKIFY